MANNVAISGGEIIDYPYGDVASGNFKRQMLRERVTITANANSIALVRRLPGRARIIAAQLLNVTANAVTGTNGTNGTADTICLVGQTGTATAALTTGTSTTTTSFIATIGTVATGSNALVFQGVPLSLNQNTSSNELYLYLVPIAFTGTTVMNLSAPTNTGGYRFIATSTSTTVYNLDVIVHYDVYQPISTATA